MITDSIVIDGGLDEAAWQDASWTEYFVDIEGETMETPRYSTKAKIGWDTNYLYFGAQLQEPNLWATFTERESIIFHENNFEIFYCKFEIDFQINLEVLLLLEHFQRCPPINKFFTV